MPKARLVEVAEAVVERLTKRLDDPASATVEREYVVEIDAAKLEGRKVYVLPGGVENQGPASRAEDFDDYKVGVVVVERHAGQRSDLSEWADERVLWVQTQIWERLQDVREGLLLDCLWPQLSNWLAYDYDLLREKKLFWSEVEVTFREDD
jgi:hypothetical protein